MSVQRIQEILDNKTGTVDVYTLLYAVQKPLKKKLSGKDILVGISDGSKKT